MRYIQYTQYKKRDSWGSMLLVPLLFLNACKWKFLQENGWLPWCVSVCTGSLMRLFFLPNRESFPNGLQFTILMRFTVDQTQTPNLKVNDVRACVRVCLSVWERELSVCDGLSKRRKDGQKAGNCVTMAHDLMPAHTGAAFLNPMKPWILGCDWIAIWCSHSTGCLALLLCGHFLQAFLL